MTSGDHAVCVPVSGLRTRFETVKMSYYSGHVEIYCCRRYVGRVQWRKRDDGAIVGIAPQHPVEPAEVYSPSAPAPYPIPSGDIQAAGEQLRYRFACPFCDQEHSVEIIDVSWSAKPGRSPAK